MLSTRLGILFTRNVGSDNNVMNYLTNQRFELVHTGNCRLEREVAVKECEEPRTPSSLPSM